MAAPGGREAGNRAATRRHGRGEDENGNLRHALPAHAAADLAAQRSFVGFRRDQRFAGVIKFLRRLARINEVLPSIHRRDRGTGERILFYYEDGYTVRLSFYSCFKLIRR